MSSYQGFPVSSFWCNEILAPDCERYTPPRITKFLNWSFFILVAPFFERWRKLQVSAYKEEIKNSVAAKPQQRSIEWPRHFHKHTPIWVLHTGVFLEKLYCTELEILPLRLLSKEECSPINVYRAHRPMQIYCENNRLLCSRHTAYPESIPALPLHNGRHCC